MKQQERSFCIFEENSLYLLHRSDSSLVMDDEMFFTF